MCNIAVTKTVLMFLLLCATHTFCMKKPDLIVEIESGKKIAYFKKNITKKKLQKDMTKIIACNSLFIHMVEKKFGLYIPPKYTYVTLKNFTRQEYEITDKNNYIVKGKPYTKK